MWVDLESNEKQLIIQSLFSIILEYYSDPALAKGILGDVITLANRPPRSELRSAKEFSTLLNACGRNRRAEVGVKVCLGDAEAYDEGKALLQQHRANLAMALRRLEDGGYEIISRDGLCCCNDVLLIDTYGVRVGAAYVYPEYHSISNQLFMKYFMEACIGWPEVLPIASVLRNTMYSACILS